ncbi:MAG TPA: hypothetical protein PLZ61_02255 [Candidatus Cryosericum sp.]|nr:hypothetical protein [Candidatus Cryosericum sp.]
MRKPLQSTVLFAKPGGDAQAFALASFDLASAGDDGLIWHPLIYPGVWEHPAFGVFEVTHDDIALMLAAFEDGVPTALGIPIDERNDHLPNPEGAYGWIRALEIRDVDGYKGVLCCGVEYTELGKAKIASRELPFISAHFQISDAEDVVYKGHATLIKGAALTSRPFFWQQPEMQIAASAYNLREQEQDNEEGGASAQSTGGASTMTEAQARAQVEEALGTVLTDEEWAKISEGRTFAEETDETKTEADAQEEQVDAEAEAETVAAETSAESVEEAAAEESSDQAEVGDIEASAAPPTEDLLAELAELKRKIAELEGSKEVAASAIAELETFRKHAREEDERRTREMLRAIPIDGGRKEITASAVDVLTNLAMNPCAETAQAVIDHVKQFGGIQTFQRGEIATAGFDPTADPAVQVAALPVAADTKAKILEKHRSTGTPVQDLYRQHLAELNNK